MLWSDYIIIVVLFVFALSKILSVGNRLTIRPEHAALSFLVNTGLILLLVLTH